MISSLVAISGMLAADAGAAARSAPVAAVEISFVTHAGEGAAGIKRFGRDGCYQSEFSGGTGGGNARDSEAGCHRPADVEPVFARLSAIPADALAREGKTDASAARGAPARGLPAGGPETKVVLVRPDGSRWAAMKQATADEILRAVNDLPEENQWYAQPPAAPIGKGAQLLALSVAVSGRGGQRRVEAALASDGRWWCHRTVPAPPEDIQRLPAKNPPTVTNAPARLGRILAGARSEVGDDAATAEDKGDQKADGTETSIEVVWPAKERAPLRPWRLRSTVAERFAAEMKSLSPACAVR